MRGIRLHWLLAAFWLVVVAGPAWAQSAPGPAASAPAAAAEDDRLSGLIGALDTLERLRLQASRAAERAQGALGLDSELAQAEARFAELAGHAGGDGATTATQEQLLDLDDDLRLARSQAELRLSQLRDVTQALEAVLQQLREEARHWQVRAAQAQSLQAAGDLVERLRLAQGELATQTQRLLPLRDRLLSLLDRATQLRTRMALLHEDLLARRQRIGETLRGVEQEPLWRLLGQPHWETQALRNERRLQWHAVGTYLWAHAALLLLGSLLTMLACSLVIAATRDALRKDPAATRNPLRQTLLVLQHRHWVAMLLGLMAVAVLAPEGGPIAFYDFGGLLVPIPAAVLVLAVLGPGMRTVVCALTAAVLLSPFRSLLELDPLADRLKTLLQLLLVGGALGWELARGYLPQTFPLRLRGLLRQAGFGVLAVLVLALYATVVGHVGLARTLRNGVLGTLGAVMVCFALYHALLGVGMGLLRTPLLADSLLVRHRRATLDRALDLGLRTLAVLGVGLSAINGFGFGDDLPRWLDALQGAHIVIGSASLPIAAVLSAGIVLLATAAAVWLLRLLLDDGVLPRLSLKPGVSFAVSTLVRYTVGVIGFLLALAAAGIDLGKVTLLAGAIGVGVGLGLQNIITNFISGIMLLIEQPIHVGDLIDVNGVVGNVRRIGIRASVIRTSQGADVIVPNGDLLSRQVINWTFRDRGRRVDIEIGVGYGSDTAQVAELLRTTAQQHALVLADPPPQVLLLDFGPDALRFRLAAWVADVDSALSVGGELRALLPQRLGDAGIKLPLPQREVWLHPADDKA